MIRTLHYSGPADGPHLLILGAIHGNEVCGARALEKLSKEFESGARQMLRGRCTLVPICNERAYVAGKRFIDENLNRVFEPQSEPTTYERKIANLLTPLVAECDYVLDLHSMQAEGEPFVFLNAPNAESEKLCEILGVRWILAGWPDLYEKFPEKPSCCTQTYSDRMKKPNALIECGTHGAPQADAVAYEAAVRALSHLHLIEQNDFKPSPTRPERLWLEDLFFRESAEDRFAKIWKNFEAISQGDVIGYRGVDGSPVTSPRDGVIVFPSPVSAVGTEWFYVATRKSR